MNNKKTWIQKISSDKIFFDNLAISSWLTMIFWIILTWIFALDLDYWVYQYTYWESLAYWFLTIWFFLFLHFFLVKILQRNYYNNLYWKWKYEICDDVSEYSTTKFIWITISIMTIMTLLCFGLHSVMLEFFSNAHKDFIFTNKHQKIQNLKREENNWNYFHVLYKDKRISVISEVSSDKKYKEAFLTLSCIKSWLENNEIKIEWTKIYLNAFDCNKLNSSQINIENNIMKIFSDEKNNFYDVEVKEFSSWETYYWKINLKKNS